MSQHTITPAAEHARETHRDLKGRFGSQEHAEAPAPNLPAAAADLKAALPAGFVEELLNSGRFEDDLEYDFGQQPSSRNDMSECITAVCDAINSERDVQLSWNHVYDTSGMILDDYGYLEEGRSGRIVRANLEELADWDSTEGWGQVASLRDGILKHVPVPEKGASNDYARTDVVIIEGGLVQSSPDLPVFDLDVLDSGAMDEGTVDEVVTLMGRARQHRLLQVVGDCEGWLEDRDLYTCDQCEALFTVTTGGVAHHVNSAGYVQHDADGDHVPHNLIRQP